MLPLAPEVVIPAVLAEISVPPELTAKVHADTVERTLVPKSTVAPLLIVQATTPPDGLNVPPLVNVCVPVPAKLIAALPEVVAQVRVPPVTEQLPLRFTVATPLESFSENVPPVIVRLPLMVIVMLVLLDPVVCSVPPSTMMFAMDKFAPAVLFIRHIPLPVLTIRNTPEMLKPVAPPNPICDVCVALGQFQVTLAKAWPIPPGPDVAVVWPLIRLVEPAFQVHVGIVP